jgi:hypothetical protein
MIGRTAVGTFALLFFSSGVVAFAQGKPEGAKPEIKPPVGKLEITKPEASKPEASKPEASKPEAAKPMGPPSVPKEMDALKIFVGDWRCTGEAAGPEPGKMHKSTSENVIKPDFGGFWQSVRHHEAKSKDNPAEFTAQGWWGYDATTKQFSGLFAGSYGVWDARASKGWEGDTLVWRGVLHNFMGNEETQFKHTFLKKTDKEIAERFEVRSGDKWSTLEENVCKKK